MLNARKYSRQLLALLCLALGTPFWTAAQNIPNAEQGPIMGGADYVDRATRAEITVNSSGAAINTDGKYVPFYGYYADYGTKGQFIIPKSDLSSLPSGSTITKLRFYYNATNVSFFGTSAQVDMANLTASVTNFSGANFITGGLTNVYNGTSLSSDANGYVDISLSSTFIYNGGSLLISVGGYGSDCGASGSNWYSVSKTNAAVYAYNDSSGTIPTSASNMVSYAPKTTIYYTAPASYSITAQAYPQSVGCTVKINSGTATQTSTTASVSGSTTLTASAGSGYQFVNWTASDGSVVSYNTSYTFTPSAAATYQANFTSTTPISISVSTPWTETFESYGHATLLPGTWATPTRFNSLPQVVQWNPYEGNRALEMREASGNSCMAVLPLFDKPLNSLTLSFYRMRGNSSSGYTVEVGYVTNPSDASTFTVLETVSTPSGTSHVQYTSNFSSSAPSNSNYRLAIRFAQSGEDSWYFDNFSVSYTPPVVTPEITSVVPSCTSATVNWTGNSSTYTVKYRPEFLNENFDNNGTSLPSGWTSVASIGNGSFAISNSEGSHSRPYSAICSHTNRDDETYLISPSMDLSGVSSATLKFWMKNRNWGTSDIEECHVCYRVNGGAWNELWSTTTEHLWDEINVTLTGLAANYQVAFKCVDHYGHGLCIDDVTVTGGSWTTATSSATGSSYTITGLSESTTYQVIVQGNNSDPSDPESFTTNSPYTISVLANNASYGTVSGDGSYCDGSSCTVTATPNSCYKFVNWTESGTQVSTNASYTFTVSGDHSLVANFELELDASDITVTGTTTISCNNSTNLTAGGLTGVTYYWYSDAACTNLVYTGASFTTPALSNTTTYYVKAVKSSSWEEETPFTYTRAVQTYNVPANASSVKLEVWGAQGGDATYGGKGGYSVGTLNNLNGISNLYVYVGQQPTSTTGGWNGGGGYSSYGSSGGGATDISLHNNTYNTINHYNDRIIVAGGGGGKGYSSTYGGYGGGLNGGAGGSGSATSGGAGASQTSGGNSGTGGSGSGYAGGYGAASTNNSHNGGGGGGGWYGGGSGVGSSTDAGGGGGSGYVWTSATASSAPSGYSVSSSYYLTDAQTIAGNTSFPAPDGSTETGHSGNGYARITAIFDETCESDPKAVTVTVNCTSTMTYDANGGSGTMTDPDSPYNNGSTVTVLANSFTRTGYVFNCWNTAADGSGTKYVAGNTFTISANTTLYAQWAPIVIANTTQWNEFCAAVNGGFTYSGLTVTLTDDISVTTTAGTSQAISFQGTFDGDCHTLTFTKTGVTTQLCAPFMWIMDATIQNLHTTGTISTSHQMAAGIVGRAFGNCFFTNCRSSMEITTSRNGDGTHGGLLAVLNDKSGSGSSKAVFTGCVFDGKLVSTYSGGTTNNGGLVGCSHYNYVDFTNCLFSPSVVTNMSGGSTCTFSRPDGTYNARYFTFNNCYYTQTLGRAQAKQAYTLDYAANPVAGGTVSHSAAGTTYSCSGITAYSPGLGYDIDNDAVDELLLGNGENATLTATANSGYTFMNWTDGSDTPTGNPYAVTMGTANRSVTANFINQKTSDDWTYYIDALVDVPTGGISVSSGNVTIGNKEGLAWVISMVNALNGVTAEDAETYAALTYTLSADVDMSYHTWVPIGTTEYPFNGTFNGNGHVITGITRSTDFPHDGLFGYVSNTANIQNVVVQAELTGNSIATGAVVGTFASTGTISNVEGAGTLTGGTLTTALGGIAGNNSGTLHSSFAVATLTGNASATQLGGIVGNNTGDLLNSYSNATYSGTSDTKGGLVGSNSGTVENCYAAGIASGVSAFAGSNSGTIQYCYTDAIGSGYIGTNSTAPTGSGTYGAVQSDIKHLNYMYRDNLITKNTNNYVGNKDAISDGIDVYVDRHLPVWNGLVSALNQWVKEKNQVTDASSLYYNKDFTAWHRPLTTHINGDLPVLGFAKDNALATLNSDGKFLQYGSNQNGNNGIDGLLTAYSSETASVFHYGKATGVTHVPTANVNVYIDEDAVLLQATNPDPGPFINATVGVTFDNSDHGTHAYDYWGNKLNYDWHFMSTPLSDAKIGATYNDYAAHGFGSDIDIKTLVNSYFPNGLPMTLHDENWRWDFYTYYEPEYHWINMKRNKNNHYHVDGGWSISYTYNADDQAVGDEASLACVFTPGKGYMMAISKDVFMNSTGTLNRGNVPIRLTLKEPDDINYASGWNLVGNPYQAYLNINSLNRNLYIYDADQGVYAPYAPAASGNPATPSQYIHPHQAFFVHAASDGEELIFTQAMASTETTPYSYYRDDRIDYPLVNLYAENNAGQRDLTVVEFHRPELGGARKLETMRNAPFTIAAHYAGMSYGILFATDDIERIPVRFKTDESGWVTLTWSTHNGVFSKLLLIDNKLGVEHNMLADNSYTFEASPDDYSSRFYIVYDCSGMGIEENEDDGGASTGSATFAYINNGNIVIDVDTGHGASIQVIDVLGRVLYSKTIAGTDGTSCTVSTKGLAKGVYLIRLADGHNVKTQKLVVQ